MPVRAGIANSIIPNKKKTARRKTSPGGDTRLGVSMDKVYHETHDLVKTFQND